MSKIKSGTWVEIKKVILTPSQRAPQVPDDTKKVPYVMRVSGFLTSDANLNDEVTIKTLSARLLSGKLARVCPSYTHSFGETVEELLTIGLGGEI